MNTQFSFGSVLNQASAAPSTTSGTGTTATTANNVFSCEQKSTRNPVKLSGARKKGFPAFGTPQGQNDDNDDDNDDDTAENPPRFKVPVFQLSRHWRHMEWTEGRKAELMKSIESHTPSSEKVSRVRVLLLGPVSSGKSSFISSVQSVFNGRVTNRAMVGSFPSGFTKKIQSFNINSAEGEPTALVLVDLMGLKEEPMAGLSLHDILSVIKGHVPDGHKFSPDKTIDHQTVGLINRPSLDDRIHCVAFVVDANSASSYPEGLNKTIHLLRTYISDLGVHQVALLTHIDQICKATSDDVSNVYRSVNVKLAIERAAALLGMSPSYVVPVKNYSSELDVDLNTDVLLLSAVDHILQYCDLSFQDSAEAF